MPDVIQVGTDAGVDEKLGLVSIKMPYAVAPRSSLGATLQVALFFIPVEVSSIGLPVVKRDVKQRAEGGFDVTFLLEGHFEPTAAHGEEFSLEGTTTETRIEAHDNLRMLIEKYDGDPKEDGTVKFPIELSINGQTVGNPMHGVKGFYDPGLAWTRSILSQELPQSLVEALGCIDTPPSGSQGQHPPRLAGRRNWLKVRARAEWRGNIWKLSETWMLSGKGGWNPDIYRRR